MNRRNEWLLSGALATVMVVGAFACVLFFQLSGTVEAVGLAANGTLANINRPCKGVAGPDACGTLAQINKVAIAAGDVANASAMQVKQSGELIKATTRNIDAVGKSVTGTTDALTETAKNASGSLQTITGHITPVLDSTTAAVGDIGAVARGILPTETAFNQTVRDFDAALKNPYLSLIEANIADMTTTGKHMMVTTDAVETKMTQCTLHPTVKCALKSEILFGAQVGGYLLK